MRSFMFIAGCVCMLVTTSWMCSALILSALHQRGNLDPGRDAVKVARWIFHEVKPFFQTIAVIKCAAFCIPLTPWDVLNVLILAQDFYYFYNFKDTDDDDDRWKRRKQKVLDKIEVVNGKLAVNPA